MVGQHLGKIGRKNALLGAICIMTLATAMFAVAGLIEDDNTFYIISFLARLIQGIAAATLLVTVPSIIALEYPENQAKY